MPTSEANIMPPKTGVPTLRRANCEAPTATTNGRRPRMKANDVIMTGRKRRGSDGRRACQLRILIGGNHEAAQDLGQCLRVAAPQIL